MCIRDSTRTAAPADTGTGADATDSPERPSWVLSALLAGVLVLLLLVVGMLWSTT